MSKSDKRISKRRSVSMKEDVYLALVERAKRDNVPASKIVTDLILANIGDECVSIGRAKAKELYDQRSSGVPVNDSSGLQPTALALSGDESALATQNSSNVVEIESDVPHLDERDDSEEYYEDIKRIRQNLIFLEPDKSLKSSTEKDDDKDEDGEVFFGGVKTFL